MRHRPLFELIPNHPPRVGGWENLICATSLEPAHRIHKYHVGTNRETKHDHVKNFVSNHVHNNFVSACSYARDKQSIWKYAPYMGLS